METILASGPLPLSNTLIEVFIYHLYVVFSIPFVESCFLYHLCLFCAIRGVNEPWKCSSFHPYNKKRIHNHYLEWNMISQDSHCSEQATSCDHLHPTKPLASATNHQPTLSTVEEKSYNFNVCSFHECNLILFEARTNWESYIRCQVDQCPIFMHQDSAYYYMSSV